MSSRLSMLQTNLGHQRDVVSQYERALASANTRLQESHARYQQYSQRLTEARQRHTELADSIRTHENELRVLKDEDHENTIAYLQWEWLRMDEDRYGIISADDTRLSDGGFRLTLGPADVDVKVTFRCALITD